MHVRPQRIVPLQQREPVHVFGAAPAARGLVSGVACAPIRRRAVERARHGRKQPTRLEQARVQECQTLDRLRAVGCAGRGDLLEHSPRGLGARRHERQRARQQVRA